MENNDLDPLIFHQQSLHCKFSNENLLNKKLLNDDEYYPTVFSTYNEVLNLEINQDYFSHSEIINNKIILETTQCIRNDKFKSFPKERISDFKHLIYNLLVEYYNNPEKSDECLVHPFTLIETNGIKKKGFKFNEKMKPEKKLSELYARHIRKSNLEDEKISPIFIQDLYKFYFRSSVELLSKYFEKIDKYTFLYGETPLFINGETLEEAEKRLKSMKTRSRAKKRKYIK